MKLNNPIFINNGSNDPEKVEELDIFYMDRPSSKVVLARLHPALRPLVLWRGKEYDDIGDYTQLQMENRVIELLGNDPNLVIQSLSS